MKTGLCCIVLDCGDMGEEKRRGILMNSDTMLSSHMDIS